MTLQLVSLPPKPKCRFVLVSHQGRKGNRRAIYVCKTCPYPSGDLPFVTRPLPKHDKV